MSPTELSDLITGLMFEQLPDSADRASYVIAADDAANDPELISRLRDAETPEDQIEILLTDISARLQTNQELAPQGVGEWISKLSDAATESFHRTNGLPVYGASVLLAELRKPLNEQISVFLGDVFQYLNTREQNNEPGEIPKRFLAKLQAAEQNENRRNGEPPPRAKRVSDIVARGASFVLKRV